MEAIIVLHGRSAHDRFKPLDGLRGLASLGVVAFHAYTLPLFWLWSCVDLFFVLSGFLISSILLRGHDSGSLTLKNFWIRRILRIWPVYYLTYCCVIAYGLVHRAIVHGRAISAIEVLQPALFLQNVESYCVGECTWVGQTPRLFMFDHSWSVAAEEQFYLLFPLILLGLRARTALVIPAMFLALALGAVMRSEKALMAYPFDGMNLLGTRLDGLALGVILAFFYRSALKQDLCSRLLWVTVVFAVMLGLYIVVPYVVEGYLVILEGGQSLSALQPLYLARSTWLVTGFSLMFFSTIAGILLRPDGWLAKLLSARPLVYMGSISYALYMFHIPILVFFCSSEAPLLGEQSVLRQAAFWFVSLGSAHLSKQLIEKRFDAWKGRFPAYRNDGLT